VNHLLKHPLVLAINTHTCTNRQHQSYTWT